MTEKEKEIKRQLERLNVLENTFKIDYYRRIIEEEQRVARSKARRHFGNFVKHVKPNYRWAWHNKLLAQKLNDFAHGRIRRLMIFCPPRHGKSELGSRLLPAYILGINPNASVIAASYSSALAKRMSRDVQRIMDDPLYSEVFPRVRLVPFKKKKGDDLSTDNYSRTAELFDIVGHTGGYRAAGVDTGITGMGASHCFEGFTRVLTDSGYRLIMTLKVGDSVWSYNHEAGKPELRRIENVCSRDVPNVVQVKTASGSKIVCTPDHPFFVNGKGYEQAENLKNGFDLIKVGLPQSKKISVCSSVRYVQSYIRKIKSGLPKVIESWAQRNVLLKRLFKCAPCCEEQKKVHNLSETNENKNTEILFENLQTKLQETTGYKLPFLQNGYKATKPQYKILLNVMQRLSSFCEYAREVKSELQRWYREYVPFNILQVEACHSEARSLQVFGMQFENRTSRTPHKREQTRQRTCKPDNSMRELSHHTPQVTHDTVSSVTRLSEGTYTVYDIQVEGNHNFFAEDILVHNCVIDDPLKDMKSANSATIKNSIEEWYNSTLYTRLTATGAVLVIQTRWAEDDLAGRLLANHISEVGAEEEKWDVLSLPAISTGIPSEYDAREEEGVALWPEEYPVSKLLAIKGKVGGKVWASLFQQEPAPEDGNVINTSWFKTYKEPPEFDFIFGSWDFTFKDTEKSDYVVGQIWGIIGVRRYLIRQYREKASFTRTIQMIMQSLREFPTQREVLVEEKANGAAIIDTLKHKIGIIVPYSPTESKQARAAAVAPQIEAGNVYLPDMDYHPDAYWVDDYINEWKHFPNGSHDDQVDATTQALIRVSNSFGGWLSATTSGENEEVEESAISDELAEIFGFNVNGRGGMGLGF